MFAQDRARLTSRGLGVFMNFWHEFLTWFAGYGLVIFAFGVELISSLSLKKSGWFYILALFFPKNTHARPPASLPEIVWQESQTKRSGFPQPKSHQSCWIELALLVIWVIWLFHWIRLNQPRHLGLVEGSDSNGPVFCCTSRMEVVIALPLRLRSLQISCLIFSPWANAGFKEFK